MKIIEDRYKINKDVELWINYDIKPYICNGISKNDRPCRSTLLVSPGDIFERYDYDSSLKPIEVYSFKCPICGTITNIDINTYSISAIETIKGIPYRKRF